MINKILYIAVCLFGFVILIFGYNSISKKIPISYYDENLWVSSSYFFQFYIQGNYSKDIWDNPYSSDQPNVTKFLFGAWLYPEFVKAQGQDPDLDYAKFLINNGFVFSNNLDKYKHDIESKSPKINGNIDLIYRARQVNTFLLALTIVIIFIYFANVNGFIFSLIFVLFYANNSLILESSLRAHSESAFILFFNLAIIFMLKFLSEGKKYFTLVLFSIFVGLCMSTKLNGAMLYLPYLIIITFFGFKRQIISMVLPLIISMIVFWTLNPYVYSNPLVNTIKMFAQRSSTLMWQISAFPDAYLPSIFDRAFFVFKSLFNSTHIDVLNYAILFLFMSGLYIEIKNIKKGNKLSKYIMIIFISTLMVTLVYLQLAWPRYLVHLVFFYVYYSSLGLHHFFATYLRGWNKYF